MIAFNQIPIDIRTPGQYIEFDGARATSGLPVLANRILIIGQRLALGTVAALIPTRVVRADQGAAYFGKGSQIDRMISRVFAADPQADVDVIALDDLVAGTAATGTITVTSAATTSGTIALMIAGQQVPVGVLAGDTLAAVAGKIVAAVNADLNLPVTAANVAGVVTLTSRWKGTTGNDVDLRVNYYAGQSLPAGIALAIAAMAGGAGNPDIATAFAALGDGAAYRSMILGFADAATMTAVETELTARWGPVRQSEGLAYGGARGSYGTLSAFGAARNAAFDSFMGANKSPSPSYEWAASYGAVCGYATWLDPARPLQTLALPGILPPAAADRFSRTERELLLRDGISTFTVDAGGTVFIERAITTYQTNPLGAEDQAWLDITTPLTLAFIRHAVRNRIALKYPRHKLAGDDAQFSPGQFIVTPRILRAELIALFREMEEAGLVEDFDQFKADLIVERDATDKGRVNALIPPNIVNQLRVFAGRVEFRL
jgi:phage tail sheath gpL-like